MAESAQPEGNKAGEPKVERGVQHPSEDLGAAVTLLESVKNAIGYGPASRETVVAALGFKSMSGHAQKKLGVLSHFGLIEKTGSGSLRISELGKSILMPTSAEERRRSIVEAVKRPALYAALINRYAGHALPTLLPNLLVREHRVFVGSSENAARAFRDSVSFAQLLRNGVLYDGVPSDDSPNDASEKPSNGAGSDSTSIPPLSESSGAPAASSPKNLQAYTIALDKGGRVATITIPLPVSGRDLKKIGAWVRYMTDIVDDEEAPDISSN